MLISQSTVHICVSEFAVESVSLPQATRCQAFVRKLCCPRQYVFCPCVSSEVAQTILIDLGDIVRLRYTGLMLQAYPGGYQMAVDSAQMHHLLSENTAQRSQIAQLSQQFYQGLPSHL